MPEISGNPSEEETKRPTEEEEDEENKNTARTAVGDEEHDPYFPPIITLPEVIVNSGEEDEDVLLRMRAKLFRYDAKGDPSPEWKERGTGDVKLLRHKETGSTRVLMRRDKTLKLCANHAVQPWMQLRPNCGSDRAFVWSVQADFADEEPKPELLAIRFANAENAKKFREKFEDAVKQETSREARRIRDAETGGVTKEEESLSAKMKKVNIKK